MLAQYRGLSLSTSLPSGIADIEINTDENAVAAPNASASGGFSQSVTFGASPSEVTGVRARVIAATGIFYGLVRVSFYADDGSDLPTGAPLVSSDLYAMDSAAATGTDYYFPLSGWTPDASTKYVLGFDFFDFFKNSQAGSGFGVYQHSVSVYADGAKAVSGAYSSAWGDAQNSNWSVSSPDLDITVYSVSGSAGGGAVDTGDMTYKRARMARSAR